MPGACGILGAHLWGPDCGGLVVEPAGVQCTIPYRKVTFKWENEESGFGDHGSCFDLHDPKCMSLYCNVSKTPTSWPQSSP